MANLTDTPRNENICNYATKFSTIKSMVETANSSKFGQENETSKCDRLSFKTNPSSSNCLLANSKLNQHHGSKSHSKINCLYLKQNSSTTISSSIILNKSSKSRQAKLEQNYEMVSTRKRNTSSSKINRDYASSASPSVIRKLLSENNMQNGHVNLFPLTSTSTSTTTRIRFHHETKAIMKRIQVQNISITLALIYSLAFLLILPSVSFLNGRFPASEAIKLQPDGNKYLWSGDSTVVSCRNNNNVKNAKTRWIGPNGHDITEDKSKRIHTESAGTRLVIMNAIAQQDDGQYKCLLGSQGLNGAKWEEADFSLKTYKRPSFEGTEQRVLMQEDLAGQLVCRVEFDPAASGATITWTRQGTPIDEMHDSSYRIIEYDLGSMESKLLIKPVKRQHAGSYTCHAIAETLHLSRPFEQTIELDVQFGPTFNSTREIVWVERRLQQQQQHLQHNSRLQQQQQQQQQQSQQSGDQQTTVMSNLHQTIGANRRRLSSPNSRLQASQGGATGNNNNNNNNNGTVLVELNCVCDSNPTASIVWSSSSSRLAIMKGQPSHVLDETTMSKNSTQTQSILLIEYQLDPNWEFKQDEYICSASNMIGQATKRFSIQQGDTSPAYEIAPKVNYNQATSLINFVLLGPKEGFVGSTSSGEQQKFQQPDVDAFRIRIDGHNSHSNHQTNNNNNNNNNFNQNQNQINNNNNPNINSNDGSHSTSHKASNSVILPLRTNPDTKEIILPQNVTVSLASLPAGQHKLFLEAHNAVGWSRHKTELGEFKLISNDSISKIQATKSQLLLMLMSTLCLTAFSLIPNLSLATSTSQLKLNH